MADRVRRPALQLYAADDVLANGVAMEMGHEAFGVHMRLYCRSWLEVGIPADFDRLASWLRITRKRLDTLWKEIAPAWEERDGRLFCPEQEEKREEHDTYIAKQRENGRKGGRPGGKALGSENGANTGENESQENPPVSQEEAKKTSAPAPASATALTTLPPTPLPGGGSERGDQDQPAPAPPPSTRGRARRSATPKTLLPEDWTPPESLRALAAQEGKDFGRETEKFRDWAAGGAHKKADWIAAFRNWLRSDVGRGGAVGGIVVPVAVQPDDGWRSADDARTEALKAEEAWLREVAPRFDALPDEARRKYEERATQDDPRLATMSAALAPRMIRSACLRLYGQRIGKPAPAAREVANV